MIRTPLCDLLGINYPIIQGGMAWVGTAELAAAVSEAGGLGIIGAGNAPADWVSAQIRRTRARTDKPFGVNVMLLSPFAKEVIETIIEERVPVVATGAGNPGIYVPRFKEVGIITMAVVASVALAKRLERSGVDIIVAEGMESGGHIGEVTTMALLPQVVDAVALPVVAAGGFADGRGLVAALSLGAQGIQMGTRFVCCAECIAHPNYKRKVVEAKERSTVATGLSLGHPIRCIENKMTRQFTEMERNGVSAEELEAFGAGKMKAGVIDGDCENGSLMAGQIAGLIKDIKPARAIIEEIMSEAEEVLEHLSRFGKLVIRV
ncbi:MAG: enoyl-[acyl-carrier-protein] reductase FabK [Dehalococcoidia bacterium]|nr:enoyl-[acyl-carrier-protein] reductase FabK [Dehalococcoidia bacterium]